MSYSPEEVLARSLEWMRGRGWERKLAKSATGQSLLEHTLIELDVFFTIEPVLVDKKAFALTENERSILAGSLLCHDIGKETEEWQQYVHGSTDSYVPHIRLELLNAVAPEVCRVVGADEHTSEVKRTVELCARYHHSRPERNDSTILEAILDGEKSFLALAHIVMDIDRLCSAQTAQSAASHLNRCDLGKHIAAEWHQVSVRGVSSSFLHKAAQEAFEEEGWHALIYFADATVYYASRAGEHSTPQFTSISARLCSGLKALLTREMSSLMVGNPTGNMLPKPDLVSWQETRQYLEQAGRKISSSSFAKKKLDKRAPVVKKYLAAIGVKGTPDTDLIDLNSQRISRAQPEMIVFKMFKALTDPNKIQGIGNEVSRAAMTAYEDAFGNGSWEDLQSTSTLMPAKEMVATIDRYWRLDASLIGYRNGTTIETLPDNHRMNGLIDLLNRIINSAVQKTGIVSPREDLANRMASELIHDVVRPADANSDACKLAEVQAAHYIASKPIAGRETRAARYTCPICNSAFDSGRKAAADFIDNPQTHTNRGVSHGSFGYIMICNACYYERLLRQLLMGTRPAEIVTMTPPWNLGPRNGGVIVREIHDMVDAASNEMCGRVGDFSSGFSFGLTEQIAARLTGTPDSRADGTRLLDLLRYRIGEDKINKRKSDVEKRLKEEYAEDLDALNDMCGTAYGSWGAVTEAVCTPGPLPDDLDAVRCETLKLYSTMALVCETPNLIFIPLTYAIGGKESDANSALRRLFAALLIHRNFRTTVVVHKEPCDAELINARGAAWVPPVPVIRTLIGSDWVSVEECDLWLERIGAAARLAQATKYSERSAIYQTIFADPAEALVRRIENQNKERMISIQQVALINRLPFFRTSKRHEEVSL